VTYFVGWSAWLDIAPYGVNKATGVADAAELLGVSAEKVLAFGDGRNDIELLSWAGRGVAIGDAPHEVHAAADASADRFADGGPVAELLHWFG
jgi:hydroxymethylpyrimidine pyrophosphatase-like HAD family hydrolase